MGLNPENLIDEVIRPALEELGYWSPDACALLLGTAAQESRLEYLRQIKGPALGLWQMEPATHADIYDNYLIYRSSLRTKARAIRAVRWSLGSKPLTWNLRYASAMARIHYLRVPKPLPFRLDFRSMARYWKEYYNTEQGAGTELEFLDSLQLVKKSILNL